MLDVSKYIGKRFRELAEFEVKFLFNIRREIINFTENRNLGRKQKLYIALLTMLRIAFTSL